LLRRLDDESHLAVFATFEAIGLATDVAQPVELRALMKRVRSEFEQFAIPKVSELGGASRIVTLGDHGKSVCTR